MSIPVRCQCGKAFAARDELAGKRVKCPSCGGVLAIPAAPALQPLDDDPLGLGGVDLSAAGLGSGPAPAAGGRPRGPLPKSPLPKSPSRRASDSQNQKLLLICAGVGGGGDSVAAGAVGRFDVVFQVAGAADGADAAGRGRLIRSGGDTHGGHAAARRVCFGPRHAYFGPRHAGRCARPAGR